MGSFKAVGLACLFLPLLAAGSGHAADPKTGPQIGQGDAAGCAGLAGQSVATTRSSKALNTCPRAG